MRLVVFIILIIVFIIVYIVLPHRDKENNIESDEDFEDTDFTGYKSVVVKLRRREDETRAEWNYRKRCGITEELKRQIARYEEHGWEQISIAPNYSRNNGLLSMGGKRNIESYNVIFRIKAAASTARE